MKKSLIKRQVKNLIAIKVELVRERCPFYNSKVLKNNFTIPAST